MTGGNIIIEQSKITTSGIGGGDIFIRTGQFKLLNSDIVGEVLAEQNGGIIDIRVADNMVLDGVNNYIYISSSSRGAGHGEEINLSSKQLSLINGVKILAAGYGTGNAGLIFIKIADTFNFLGKYIFEKRTSSSILSAAVNTGQGGNIEIEAHNLTINGGAQIGSATFSSGKSGDVRVKVNDTLTITGKSEVGLMSGIFASTQPRSIDSNYNTGNAGNIEVEAEKINLLDGVIISSNSGWLGNAGVIKVKTYQK